MAYRFVDHTADVAADLTASDLGGLFSAATQALADTITDRSTVRLGTEMRIELEGPTPEDLLVDWLNELLYRFEVQDLLIADADVTVRSAGDRWQLTAIARGERFDPVRHPSRVLVKSATYHGLHVRYEDGEWTARIVLDI